MDKLRGLTAVALLRVLSWLPFSALQVLGTLLGRLFYVSGARSRRSIEANLLYCFPHWSAEQRDAFTRRNLQETAKTTVEMGALWHWPSDKTLALIQEVHGLSLLDAALAKKRGVIVLAPHLGNWEVIGFFLAQVANITSLYAPAKIPLLDRLIYAGRSRNGARLAPTNAGGVKALLKALKAGEMVGILPDQVPEESSGVFASFFGRPALTMTLVASLVQRTGAEVLCCYAKRRSDRQGFDICLLPAVDDLRNARDEIAAATAMNASVERCVNDCSEQYQWEYKRFREQKDDSLSLYLTDRRLQYRRQLDRPVWVNCREGAGWSGSLLNLTSGGLMLSTKDPLVAGTKYTITLEFPGQAGKSVTVEVKCIWSQVSDEPGEYRSGMLVTFMTQQDALCLLVWLEQNERKPWRTSVILLLLEGVAWLPLPIMHLAGYSLGSVARWLQTRQQRYIDMNIRSAFPALPGLPQLVRESSQSYGRKLLGKPFVRLASSRRVDSAMPLVWRPAAALEAFRLAVLQQRGAVLLVPNMGHWEILLREMARQAPLTLLYQPPLMDIRDRMVYRAAIRDHYAVLPMQEGFIDTTLCLLQQGGLVALMPDQALVRDKRLLAPLFGHNIRTMDLSRLAETSVEVFCAHISGQAPEVKYEIVLTQVSLTAIALNQSLEQAIQDCPQQYHWHGRLFPK